MQLPLSNTCLQGNAIVATMLTLIYILELTLALFIGLFIVHFPTSSIIFFHNLKSQTILEHEYPQNYER